MSSAAELGPRRAFGRRVLANLSRLVLDRFNAGLPADIDSEQLFRDQLSVAFSDDLVAGEELGMDPGADQQGWLIDPLDGSTNHGHGIPLFAVSIAYIHGGSVVLGWVSDPVRGEWFEAWRGKGILRGGPSPSLSTSMESPVLSLSDHWRRRYPDWRSHFPESTRARSLGSIALELAWIASGRLQGGAWYRTHPWDVGAGELLISESGGDLLVVPDGGPGERFALSSASSSLMPCFEATLAGHGMDAQQIDPD